ncbi:MAG: hypothetical protein HOQ28_10670, partial [Thermoleophilia bacterium]|nr:hypothetical protein [Thermoleophilia bacterium]
MGARGRLALVVVSTVALVCCAVSAARSTHAVEPASVWIADGTVSAIAPTANGVFIGGEFSLLGRPTGSWVDVTASGTPVARRPLIEGTVSTAASDGAGGWYIRGSELFVDGVERRGVIHLRGNGNVDSAFRLASNGEIDTIVRSGTTLYVGGRFTSVNGSARTSLAAVDTRSAD